MRRPRHPSQPTACITIENQESRDAIQHASEEMVDSAERVSLRFDEAECFPTPAES